MAISLLVLVGVLVVYVSAWFAVAAVRRDNSLADLAWGGGFLLIALVSLYLGGGWRPRPALTTGLVSLWGLRLAIYIALRNRGRGEDFRYAAWRRQWGRSWLWRSYLQVFLLQGAILGVVAAPVVLVNLRSNGPLSWLDAAGSAVWLVGFVFEAVGDWQLRRFSREPSSRGRVMDQGLWRFTRHPNYFGEATQWWGVFLIALNVPGGWSTVVGPALITFLLLRVSGVPMLERALVERIPGYRDYQRRTSAFVPLPPRRRV